MPQEKKFIFRDCYTLLQINPKSFLEWLKKAGIDPDAQRDTFDPRKKYLYKSQLVHLAEIHGRSLPDLDDYEAEIDAGPTLSALAEQFTIAHAQTVTRLDQVEQMVRQLLPLVNEITMSQRELLHVLSTRRQDPVTSELIAASTQEQGAPGPMSAKAETESASASPTGTPGPRRTSNTARKPGRVNAKNAKKKPVRGKKLPRHLVTLRDFASQHTIAMERASAAGRTGKLPIVEGRWLVNSRWASEALDEQGQAVFYEVFHERTGFTSCERCPHVSPAS